MTAASTLAHDISAGPADRTKLALFELLRLVRAQGYHFITPTPATHGRLLARPDRRVGHDLGDLLWWSLPVPHDAVPAAILDALEKAEMLVGQGGLVRSRLRVSSLQGELFIHSVYPTEAKDAVFCGPDSYRFADLVVDKLAAAGLAGERHVVDIGTSARVGAVVAGKACPTTKLTMIDINPAALQLATVNAGAAGITARAVPGPPFVAFSTRASPRGGAGRWRRFRRSPDRSLRRPHSRRHGGRRHRRRSPRG